MPSSESTGLIDWPMSLSGVTEISAETVLVTIIGAVVGGSGIVGLMFAYMRRFIDKKLDARERENARSSERRIKRLKLEEELNAATGKVIFYLHKAIVTGQHNGDLEDAWNNYQAVRAKKEDFDRSILIDNIVEEEQ